MEELRSVSVGSQRLPPKTALRSTTPPFKTRPTTLGSRFVIKGKKWRSFVPFPSEAKGSRRKLHSAQPLLLSKTKPKNGFVFVLRAKRIYKISNTCRGRRPRRPSLTIGTNGLPGASAPTNLLSFVNLFYLVYLQHVRRAGNAEGYSRRDNDRVAVLYRAGAERNVDRVIE